MMLYVIYALVPAILSAAFLAAPKRRECYIPVEARSNRIRRNYSQK